MWKIKNKEKEEIRGQEMKLRKQVICGAAGLHSFGIRYAVDGRNYNEGVLGEFVCSKCKLKIERPLTDKEIPAAKILGLIG